jgi:hypothetical protein
MSTLPAVDYTANASAIRASLSRADDHLRAALKELREARMLARDDYDGNADKLDQLVSVFEFVSPAVYGECLTWAGYLKAREGR